MKVRHFNKRTIVLQNINYITDIESFMPDVTFDIIAATDFVMEPNYKFTIVMPNETLEYSSRNKEEIESVHRSLIQDMSRA